MNIGIRGDTDQSQEIRTRLGGNFGFINVVAPDVSGLDVLFDFRPDPHHPFPNGPVIFADVMRYPLAAFAGTGAPLFGFCGWPGFFSRPSVEVSLLDQVHAATLDRLAKEWNVSFLTVNDQIGLVSPRVLAMIINEANLAFDEGIATRDDIDIAMKLGTGYPFGPFEWCDKIGAARVVDLLQALATTQPTRYVIAQALLAKA